MGRGNRNKEERHAGIARTRRGKSSPHAATLIAFERAVTPLSQRFSAAAIGKNTQEEQNQARARAVRKLPPETQCKLIEIAQGCTSIIEGLARSVVCPFCAAAINHPCLTPEGKERPICHPDRLSSAKTNCKDEGLLIEVAKAQRLNDRAREIFIYSHTGYVMQTVRKHVGAFESESAQDALEVLKQEAYLGLNDAVDRFDLAWAEDGKLRPTDYSPSDLAVDGLVKRIKANPLTYATGRVRHRVSAAKETGPIITAKSRAFDERQSVQAAVKAIQNRGGNVTVEEISEKTKIPAERVDQLLRSLATKSRLDAAVSTNGESVDTLGSLIADTAPGTETMVLAEAEREAVRAAADKLKPFQRRVIEAHFNLGGGENVEQKDLYDGVYIDPKTGGQFSSEGTVISDRAKHGIAVVRTPQIELNRLFKEGKLVFEAGTPESFELALLKKQSLGTDGEKVHEPTRAHKLKRTITYETGVPMTSGQIQDAKDQALYALSQFSELQSMRPRYRGEHELENSHQAREMVRRALIMLGDISASTADTVKAGRAARDGSHKRGALGELAQTRGWIDPVSGRVLWGKLRADVQKHRQIRARAARHAQLESSEELAELMTSV